MDAIDRPDVTAEDAAARDARPDREVEALWSALRADRRARDERKARLRAMQLADGDESGA